MFDAQIKALNKVINIIIENQEDIKQRLERIENETIPEGISQLSSEIDDVHSDVNEVDSSVSYLEMPDVSDLEGKVDEVRDIVHEIKDSVEGE